MRRPIFKSVSFTSSSSSSSSNKASSSQMAAQRQTTYERIFDVIKEAAAAPHSIYVRRVPLSLQNEGRCRERT